MIIIRILLIIVRRRRRRRAVAPTSNTASHDYHEKISLRVSIGMGLRLAALRAAGAPLLPLKELADSKVLKCWIHLENQPEDSIAKQSLIISKEFPDKNQVSLVQKVNNLCATSNLNAADLTKNNYSSFLSQIRSSLNNRITEHQLNLIKCNMKLKFYSQFRTDCHKAGCLNPINKPLHKKTLNKFRLGNHQLLIETGRHKIPKMPENLQICLFCQLNEVEHEIHFIFLSTLQ